MDNWARFVTGYQRHQKLNDRESIWTIKGEAGGLTRITELKVQVLEWNEPDNVRFKLEGINEPVRGTGEFSAAATDDIATSLPPVSESVVSRAYSAFIRWIMQTVFNAPAPAPAVDIGETVLTFRISVDAHGGMGPILNALLAPMLKPVAEDLANRIASAIRDIPVKANSAADSPA